MHTENVVNTGDLKKYRCIIYLGNIQRISIL